MGIFFEVISIVFTTVFHMLKGLVLLVPDFLRMFFSISKLVNITSPLGIILLNFGLPLSLLGVALFMLRFVYKKIKA